tara:strand:+ start:1766 stop:1981 length:216 start_codon:yes stop_codon:yes gene_type:complete
MRDNPAVKLYNSIDLSEIPKEDKKAALGGLLAPKKSMTMDSESEKMNEPLARVIRHMSVIRKKRDEINGKS